MGWVSPRQVKRRSVRWDKKAACSGLSPSLFFPPSEEAKPDTAVAKSICRTCPVKDECLEEAIVNREHGIWGGTTLKEREKIRRARNRKVKPEEGRSTKRKPPHPSGEEATG